MTKKYKYPAEKKSRSFAPKKLNLENTCGALLNLLSLEFGEELELTFFNRGKKITKTFMIKK